MTPEQITVSVNDTDSVTALIYPASKSKRLKTTIILGHGAGGNQLAPFMRLFAAALAERGVDAVTFNFVYSEKRRGAPDQKPKLEQCYLAVIDAISKQKKLKGNRLLIGGKSMGGRIASHVAPQRDEVSGLVFLGYPLHPPGRPDQLRDAHLADVRVPMLFVQGTRDSFGTPDELTAVFKRMRIPASLFIIQSGDHSFKTPKNVGTQEEIYNSILDEIVRWNEELKDKD
jgi:uncharacterized protein